MTVEWTCFTSFNRRLWDIIAAEMLASWIYNWPDSARLVCYVEDNIELPADPRITVINWQEACGREFEQLSQRASGMPAWQSDHTRRYAKKALTFVDFMNQSRTKVCWLDADLLTVKPVPQDLLSRAHHANCVISLFDGSRVQQDGTMPWTAESGFVLVDPQHQRFPEFFASYRDYYQNPRMPEHATQYWDGEVLMHAAKHSESWFDLKTECRGKSSTPLHSHWLGQYFVHVKSKRKKHFSLETYRRFWQQGQPLTSAPTRFAWQK